MDKAHTGLPTKHHAQLAGVRVILRGPFPWATMQAVRTDVERVGGFLVESAGDPTKTLAIISADHIGTVPDKVIAKCLERGVTILTDQALKDILEIGVRPLKLMAGRHGVCLLEGRLCCTSEAPWRLDLIHIPTVQGFFMDRSLDYVARYGEPLGF